MEEFDEDEDFGLGSAGSVKEFNALDAPDFDPVEYINKQFPTEVSLVGVDGFIAKLRKQQQQTDEEIRHAIRRQAAFGRRTRGDLDEAKKAVRELFERIQGIKSKAEQSEVLVRDVCRDIKSLDIAKRNLTHTITSLKRLVMLVTALEQLRTLAADRQYKEASNLLQAIENLAVHFQELAHVPKVADLLERKEAILSDLRSQLLEDYASLQSTTGSAMQDAAGCVDAMDSSVRREVITQFCLRVLEDYKKIFEPPHEASGLETAERRYAWLRRTLRDYDEKYAASFPEAWDVPCGLCEHFCHLTRQHLVEVLGSCHHTVDPELMVRVLRKSIEFENDLARKYPFDVPRQPKKSVDQFMSLEAEAAHAGWKYPEALDGPARNEAKSPTSRSSDSPGGKNQKNKDEDNAPRFKGIISECFDAYLGSWVKHEEAQLLDTLEKATAGGADKVMGQDSESYEDEEDGYEPRYLYSSAPDIFASMKGSMTKCSGFSTHQTLFEVFQVFRKVMAQYEKMLTGRLPKPSGLLTNEDIRVICSIIGTAEYVDSTLPQLADSMLRIIDPAYADRVSFSVEQELLGGVVSRSMQVLVKSVEESLEEAFSRMTRTNWAQFSQAVADQSGHIGEIHEKLSNQMEPIAAHLSKLHYRFFCDKFVQAFIPRYIAEIYRCKKISEQGAQQLLLDTSSIKTMLLEVPVIAAKGRQMPTAYSNFVLREIGKAEAICKVLSSPGGGDAESMSTLLGDEFALSRDAADIDRVLALRATGAEGEGQFSPRDEARNADMGAAVTSKFKSLQDQLNQAAPFVTTTDVKKNAADMKKKFLAGVTGLGNITGSKASK